MILMSRTALLTYRPQKTALVYRPVMYKMKRRLTHEVQ